MRANLKFYKEAVPGTFVHCCSKFSNDGIENIAKYDIISLCTLQKHIFSENFGPGELIQGSK
jgi:hypothetical protein